MAGGNNKKGLLATAGMPASAFSNFRGSVAWLYNYNADFQSDDELAFLNSEQIEFIPMFNGAYLQTERATAINGWPRPSGTNRRCFFWEDPAAPCLPVLPTALLLASHEPNAFLSTRSPFSKRPAGEATCCPTSSINLVL